ncbi:hypothetical protein PG995_001934 [Apiospora arundinis]
MARTSMRVGIALAITAQAVVGQYQNPMPAAPGGGGFFKDNPFSNAGGQNQMPPPGPPASGGGGAGGGSGGFFNDNPFGGGSVAPPQGMVPAPPQGNGGGFFQDNPFSSGGGQNQMPGTAPPMAGGIPSMGGGIPPMNGGSPPMAGGGGGGGFFNDNPFGNSGNAVPPAQPEGNPGPSGGSGGGFFNDNPFGNSGNSVPPAQSGGNSGGSPGMGGSGMTNPGSLSPSPPPGQCPGAFPSEEQILQDKPGCPLTRAIEPMRIEDLSFELAPICPDHEGKLYQSRGGATFMVQCCMHGGGEAIKTIITEDFRRCMSNCSATDDCHSVLYTARPYYGEPVGTCIMNKKGGFGAQPCGVPDQHTYAWVVDPPAIEPAGQQQLTVKCSTECPYGHGQPFKTESGEIFQLTCGKRHGTQVLHRDNQPTMMDCMNNCGKVMQCDSVDYDIHRRICYYSNHRGEPVTEAALFASAYSLGCGICGDGGGCSCKSGGMSSISA